MEREFGTKSYNPAKFEFCTIFTGRFNPEYQNLFSRKLPGNILVSAYYTPMTIRELAIELGVASVYLEDEIALLEKYHLITQLPGGKYQTRLVIFTEEYRNEFYKAAEQALTDDMGFLICNVRERLPQIRALHFPGWDLGEDALIWSFLFELIRNGWNRFRAVLGKDGELEEQLEAMRGGAARALVPVVSVEQKKAIEGILEKETAQVAEIYGSVYRCACSVMRTHAPESIAPIIKSVLANALLFHTVGLIGACAVRSGALSILEDDSPLGLFLYEVR